MCPSMTRRGSWLGAAPMSNDTDPETESKWFDKSLGFVWVVLARFGEVWGSLGQFGESGPFSPN